MQFRWETFNVTNNSAARSWQRESKFDVFIELEKTQGRAGFATAGVVRVAL